MGRFHRHDDGTVHSHDHGDHTHHHDHGDYVADPEVIGDHSGYDTEKERTLAELQGKMRIGIIEGDIETPLDADRLRGYGAQISLLNTGQGFGGECHLDAPMVHHTLDGLDLSQLDLVIIENVGNLVCPAEFDVGENAKAMVFSITEGEDKPLKYPVMFRSVEIVVVNKMDLAPYLNFDMDRFRGYLKQVRGLTPGFSGYNNYEYANYFCVIAVDVLAGYPDLWAVARYNDFDRRCGLT